MIVAAPATRPGDDPFLWYWRHRTDVGRGAPARRVLALGWTTWHLLALLRHAMRGPRRRVLICGSPSGRLLAAELSHTVLGRRVARPLLAVLPLPPTFAEYVRGRHRQAVRTGITRARRLSITAERVPTPEEWLQDYCAVRRQRLDQPSHAEAAAEVRDLLDEDAAVAWRAVDADSRAVCIGIAVVSGSDAYLSKLISRPHEGSSEARYLVHTEVVRDLIARGVRRVWADGPITTPPGVQHFQSILGYECARPALIDATGSQACTSS